MRKDFSQKLNDENDPLAKAAMVEFIGSFFGWKHIGNDEADRPAERDLVFMTQSDVEIWGEAERKLSTNWNERGVKNRWMTLNVPYRKHDSKADVYAMFNHHLDTVAVGAMQKLKLANTKKVKCLVEGEWIDDEMYDCHQTGFRYYTKYNQSKWVEITMYGDPVTADTPSTYRYQHQTPFLLGVTI